MHTTQSDPRVGRRAPHVGLPRKGHAKLGGDVIGLEMGGREELEAKARKDGVEPWSECLRGPQEAAEHTSGTACFGEGSAKAWVLLTLADGQGLLSHSLPRKRLAPSASEGRRIRKGGRTEVVVRLQE